MELIDVTMKWSLLNWNRKWTLIIKDTERFHLRENNFWSCAAVFLGSTISRAWRPE